MTWVRVAGLLLFTLLLLVAMTAVAADVWRFLPDLMERIIVTGALLLVVGRALANAAALLLPERRCAEGRA